MRPTKGPLSDRIPRLLSTALSALTIATLAAAAPAPASAQTAPGRAAQRPLTPHPNALAAAKAQAAAPHTYGPAATPAIAAPAPRAAPAAAASMQNTVGIAAAETGGTYASPDVSAAASPTQYVETVEGLVRVYSRTGAALASTSLATFASAPAATAASHPQVEWDAAAGRWLYAVELASTNGGANLLAYGWSANGDASNLSGGWCRYTVSTGSELEDFPRLGHDANFVSIGANGFDSSRGGFQTARLWTVATSMLAGGCPASAPATELPASGQLLNQDGSAAFGLTPAQLTDGSLAAGSPGYLVAAHDVSAGVPAGASGRLTIWSLTPDGSGHPVLGSPLDVTVARYAVPANAPQAGTAALLDTGDARLVGAVGHLDPSTGGEAIWTQHTVDGPLGAPVVHWYELNAAGATLRQQGSVDGAGDSILAGAISPSAAGGDAVLVYNRTGSGLLTELAAQSRQAGTPLGTLDSGEQILANSSVPDADFSCALSCAWEVGASASPDPVTQGTVWVSGPILSVARDVQAAQWQTRNVSLSTAFPTAAAGHYHPLLPARILDTRYQTGVCTPACTALSGGQTMTLQAAGQGGVPSGGAAAVIVNVTITGTTTAGYLTVYPAGTSVPPTSNLNYVAGQTVPNLVEVALGSGGRINLYLGVGRADVIVDIEGWVSDAGVTAGASGTYNPVAPSRILDTRSGAGSCPSGACATLHEGSTLDLQVAGQGGIPSSGVWAVVLNLTATNSSAGYVTVYPTGVARPLASNLNLISTGAVANRVVVPLGANGRLSIYNRLGSTDVIVDVGGWYGDGTQAGSGGLFTGSSAPARILDTRYGIGGCTPSCTGGFATDQQSNVLIAGRGGIPNGATAAVLNVTVVGSQVSSYLTVFPDDQPRPTASDLNWGPGQTVPNLVIVKLGGDGGVGIYNYAGPAAVIVDVMGWYQ